MFDGGEGGGQRHVMFEGVSTVVGVYVYVYVYMCIRMCICICIYVYVYVNVYICIYVMCMCNVYVYYTHTHTPHHIPTDPRTTLFIIFLFERFKPFTGYLIISSSS